MRDNVSQNPCKFVPKISLYARTYIIVKCIDGSAIRPNSFIDLVGGIVHPSNIPSQMNVGPDCVYN